MNLDDIKFLREHTGISLGECRNALAEANGAREQALEILRTRGAAIALKKSGRETSEGRIEAYVHATGKIAALVELQCETDFVAHNDLFKTLAHELAMQVAAIPPADLDALLKQNFIKGTGETVQAHLIETLARLGENIKVTRFERWEM